MRHPQRNFLAGKGKHGDDARGEPVQREQELERTSGIIRNERRSIETRHGGENLFDAENVIGIGAQRAALDAR